MVYVQHQIVNSVLCKEFVEKMSLSSMEHNFVTSLVSCITSRFSNLLNVNLSWQTERLGDKLVAVVNTLYV